MDEGHWDFEALVERCAAEDRSPRARVRRVVEWILEDPCRDCSAARLAERAAVSARTLSRLFRRETGMSPARFVARARVVLARALLERTGLGVDAVAVRSGFAGARRMRRAFRRALGAAPREIALLPPPRSSRGV
jgi:transcriptional regulator GlxA family with amidase domain